MDIGQYPYTVHILLFYMYNVHVHRGVPLIMASAHVCVVISLHINCQNPWNNDRQGNSVRSVEEPTIMMIAWVTPVMRPGMCVCCERV